MKILAIDYGSKRVGLAIGDTEVGLAFPRGVWEGLSDKEIGQLIVELVKQESIGQVAVGEPVSLSGQISDQTKSCRQFAEFLKSRLDIPVELFDERLTSRQADNAKRQGSSKKRDELAAVFLLQSWLDKMSKS